MKFSEFQMRLELATVAEQARDPATGLFVVRAIGQWVGGGAHASLPQRPKQGMQRADNPYIAVVSSEGDNPADRLYGVYAGDSTYNFGGRPAFFESAFAEHGLRSESLPDTPANAAAKKIMRAMPTYIMLAPIDGLDLPSMAFVDGHPDTLTINNVPAIPGPICSAREITSPYYS